MSNLFLAEVTNVYPQKIILTQVLNNNLEAQVQHEAYTIDVRPIAGRLEIQGVKVISPTSGTNAQNGSGFVWMPAIGDWVVCGYLEGYPDFAVCLGSLKHPYSNVIPIEAQGYQDYVVFHQSGSWIRLRDLSRFDNPSNKESTSEIKFHHSVGAEIEITEPSSGECEINVTHPSGTMIKIANDGTVNITAQKINLGSAADYKIVLGDLLKTWIESHTHMGNLGYPTGTPIQPFNNYLSETIRVQK